MKNVLLASTALLMTAGAAAAEVTFSGDARFGLRYNEAAAQETQLEKRVRLNVTGTTTTDGGVTLGFWARHQSDEATGGIVRGFAGARLFAKYNGLSVQVGNIEGAIESMPGIYFTAGTSLTGLSWSGLVTNTQAKGYFGWDADDDAAGNAREGVEVKYTMGDFSVHASHSSDSLTGGVGPRKRSAIHAAYKFQGWTVALGYQDSDINTEDKVVLLVGGKIGDYGLGFQVADNDGTTKIALNGSATFGATTVLAYVADEDTAGVDTAYGLGVQYDLGGGARLVGGIESTDLGTTRADFGVSFRF